MGRVIGVKRLVELRRSWRNCRVVFTNGVFDLIHYGHLRLLEDCKIMGDVLIVGLNSDASVKKIKGPKRPLMPFKERSKILAALEPVDYVVSFSEKTPLKLIKKLKPDVLVKGADYKLKEIVGAEEVKGWGGKVKRIKLLPGHSTSEMIKRIAKLSER